MDGYNFAMSKTAGMFSNLMNIGRQVSKGAGSDDLKQILDAGKVSASAVTTALLGSYGVSQIWKAISNDQRRKSMLEDLMMNDHIISETDPAKVKEFYATIHHMAPKLSADKNVVRELLQNFIKFDRVDLASIKSLADTQKSMQAGSTGLKDLKI